MSLWAHHLAMSVTTPLLSGWRVRYLHRLSLDMVHKSDLVTQLPVVTATPDTAIQRLAAAFVISILWEICVNMLFTRFFLEL